MAGFKLMKKYSTIALLFSFSICLLITYVFVMRRSVTFEIVKENPEYAQISMKGLNSILDCMQSQQKSLQKPRSHWPLDVKFYEERCKGHLIYDLQVRPRLSEDYVTNEDIFLYHIRRLNKMVKIDLSGKGYTLEYQYFTLMKTASSNIDIDNNFDIYPQIINLPQAAENISKGIPINQAPVNDVNMLIFRAPQKVCASKSQRKLDVLIIIKNIPIEFESRKKLRKYYDQFKIPNFTFDYVFSTGLPYSETSNAIKMKYMNSTLTGRAGSSLNAYQKKGTELTEKLFAEADEKKDILIGGFYDSYYNLTRKTFTGFRWGTIFCKDKVSLYAVMDDDVVLNVTSFANIYKVLPRHQTENLSAGIIVRSRSTSRPDKNPLKNRWKLDVHEYPWGKLPPFPRGMTSFYGVQVVKKISFGVIYAKENRIDDLMIGIVHRKLFLYMTDLHGITTKKYSDVNFTSEISGMLP